MVKIIRKISSLDKHGSVIYHINIFADSRNGMVYLRDRKKPRQCFCFSDFTIQTEERARFILDNDYKDHQHDSTILGLDSNPFRVFWITLLVQEHQSHFITQLSSKEKFSSLEIYEKVIEDYDPNWDQFIKTLKKDHKQDLRIALDQDEELS